MMWQPLSGGGTRAEMGQFEIFVSPNRPPNGWNAMIIIFNHIIHRLDRDTKEQAQLSALATLIGLLDEWKEEAERVQKELNAAAEG